MMTFLNTLLFFAESSGVIAVTAVVLIGAVFVYDEVQAARRAATDRKTKKDEQDRIRIEKEYQAARDELWDSFFQETEPGFNNTGEITQRFSRMTSAQAKAYFAELESETTDNTKDR